MNYGSEQRVQKKKETKMSKMRLGIFKVVWLYCASPSLTKFQHGDRSWVQTFPP